MPLLVADFDIQNFLLTLTFSIIGFSILLLFKRGVDNKPIRYAILILFLWFIRFLIFFIKTKTSIELRTILILFDQNLYILDTVFLFWYIKSLKSKQRSYIQLIHLIPFLFLTIDSARLYITYEASDLLSPSFLNGEVVRESNEGYVINWRRVFRILLDIFYNIYFYLHSLRLLKKYKALLLNHYSDLFRKQVLWLRNLIYIWLFVFLIPYIAFMLNYTLTLSDPVYFDIITVVGMILTAIFFSYNVVYQEYFLPKEIIEENDSFKKIDNDEIRGVFSKLDAFVKDTAIYKENSLSLTMLSEQIEIKPSQISLAIKTQNKSNFHEYINNYRIEAIKKELAETSEQIIIIAYKNGFSSKSTFNNVFKKITGITPTQYRKKIYS